MRSLLMSLSDRVAQFYSQAVDFLIIPFYASLGYGGGILTRLHKRVYYYIYISS
jgi:hypothetical protein